MDTCGVGWRHVELGGAVEQALVAYDASAYRATLVRNGYLPPGEPRLDVYGVWAMGNVRAVVAKMEDAVSGALKGTVADVDEACLLQVSKGAPLALPLWWSGLGKLAPRWLDDLGQSVLAPPDSELQQRIKAVL